MNKRTPNNQKRSDFDGDETLNKEDLEQVIRYNTRDELNEEEVAFIVDRVRCRVLLEGMQYPPQIIEEADLDSDGEIAFAEFEHVVSRSPDFMRTFHIRI